MASPSDILRGHFINTGLAVPADPAPAAGQWVVVVGPLPSKGGENSIGIVDTGTIQYGRIHRTGEVTENPTVQVMVRSTSYPKGFEKAKEVATAIRAIGVVDRYGESQYRPLVRVVDEDFVILTGHVMTAPTYLGEEENNRQLFSVNAMLVVQAMELT